MMWFRTFICLALVSAPVFAGIIGTTGATLVVSPPADASANVFENDTFAQVFLERTNFTLPLAVTVDINAPGDYTTAPAPPLPVIAAGTRIDSYFLAADPIGTTGNVYLRGTITFSTDILALIVLDEQLFNSNGVIGRSGTLYSSINGQGVEFGPAPFETLSISSDRRVLTYNLLSSVNADQIRIITTPDVPEPASAALILLGLSVFACRTRRCPGRS